MNQTAGQEPFLPIFTDRDLAERWASNFPTEERAVVAPVPDSVELKTILARAVKAGFSYVGFDPTNRVTRIPVGRIYRATDG